MRIRWAVINRMALLKHQLAEKRKKDNPHSLQIECTAR